jgi:predicted Fe-Mo cluster-binding NifX family protein
MRIVISTEDDSVSAHFGRCPSFTLIEVKEGELVQREVVPNPGHQPGFLPEYFRKQGVDMIVAGGMGQRAKILFSDNGIETVVGVSGKVDDAITRICSGTLTGGESLCVPGKGRGYGVDKTECDHPGHDREDISL